MHEPKLLILDEPTSGLDPLIQHEFLELVSEAKRRGSAVFRESPATIAMTRMRALIAAEASHASTFPINLIFGLQRRMQQAGWHRDRLPVFPEACSGRVNSLNPAERPSNGRSGISGSRSSGASRLAAADSRSFGREAVVTVAAAQP